jgi:hypothetical protein
MNNKILYLLLLFSWSISAETIPNKKWQWIYKYEMQDLNGNKTHEGKVYFNLINEGEKLVESAFYEVKGEISQNRFESLHQIQNGNFLYDVINPFNRQAFLQFSPFLKKEEMNFSNKFPKTQFPVFSYHHDQAWTFSSELVGNESVRVNGRQINASKFVLNGFRPTGPGNCMQGQPGRIRIQSWYSEESPRYIKQIVQEFHCVIEPNRMLSQETYELIF